MKKVRCECVTMEEALCGATNIDTAAACILGPAERLLGATAIFAISRPSSPNRPWSSTGSSWISSFTLSVELACLSDSDSDSFSFSFSFSFSTSLSTSHLSTSFIRSSKALTCPAVHFSSFLNQLAIMRSVPGMSSIPWDVNCAYKGGVARRGTR